jgi:acyl-CoA synthetase (AMP-forming)/AMP-acid ligase II
MWLRGMVLPGETVAMLLGPSRDSLAVLLGALRGGVNVASLPYPARAMSEVEYENQINKMCRACNARMLLLDSKYLSLTANLNVASLGVNSYQSSLTLPTPLPNSLGSLIKFTSGSTADPKGVLLSNNNGFK